MSEIHDLTKSSYRYCQFFGCPNRKQVFDTRTMVRFQDLLFCSTDCKLTYAEVNNIKRENFKSWKHKKIDA